MKSFAIITDIHGNSPDLRAVLNDINNRDIDHIICLGDMVGIGPDSNEVMELLLEQKQISYVIGNHEQAVVAAYKDLEPPLGHQNERAHHKWLADRIDEKYIDFMDDLPKSILIEEMGHRLYFTHYHLDDNNHFLPIDKSPIIEKLDELYSNTDFDIVCFGHHHIVHQFRSEKKLYFNPGSLGCYHLPVARYGIIRISETLIEEQLIKVPYNNLDFLKSYEVQQVPDREFILNIFHGAQI